MRHGALAGESFQRRVGRCDAAWKERCHHRDCRQRQDYEHDQPSLSWAEPGSRLSHGPQPGNGLARQVFREGWLA